VQPEEIEDIHRLSFDEAYSYLSCLPPKLGSYPYFELLAADLGYPVFIEIDKELRGKEKEDAYVYESLQDAIRCLQERRKKPGAQDETTDEALAVKLLRVARAHSHRKGHRKQMAWLIIYSWEHRNRYINEKELRESGIPVSPKVLNRLARYFGLERPKPKQEGHKQEEDEYPVFTITRQSLEVAKLSLLQSILPQLAWRRYYPKVKYSDFWVDSPLDLIEAMHLEAALTDISDEKQRKDLERRINEQIQAIYGERSYFKLRFAKNPPRDLVKNPPPTEYKFRISASFNPRAYLSFLAKGMKTEEKLGNKYEILDSYLAGVRELFGFRWGSPIYFSITIGQYERPDIDHALKEDVKIGRMVYRMAQAAKKAQRDLEVPSSGEAYTRLSLGFLTLPVFLLSHLENLDVTHEMIKTGHFTEAYVEMRRFLENFSWDVLNDLLILGTPPEENFQSSAWRSFAFCSPSPEWYSATSRSRCNPSEFLSAFREKQKGNEGKRGEDIDVAAPLEYPTVLAGLIANTKIDENDQKKICDLSKFPRVPCVDLAMLLDRLLLIQKRLQENSNGNAVDELNALMSRISKLRGEAEKLGVKGVVPPFPTQDLVIRLVEKLSGAKGLYEEYENLSSFVHSYGVTRSPYPFCSIYEIKVMRAEMDKFADMIGEVATSYVKYCDEFAKNSNRQISGTESRSRIQN